MKNQGVLNKATIMLLVMLVMGCADDTVEDANQLPEVNDVNCQQENIMKITDKGARAKFAGLCIRRGGDPVKSTPQSW